MQGNYLIPANSKRGQLIFSIFRPVDLIIAGIGSLATIIMFVAIQPESIWSAIITLLPLLVCAFLVIPVPNYHNMLCFLKNIYVFLFVEKQQFTWEGWNAKDEFKE